MHVRGGTSAPRLPSRPRARHAAAPGAGAARAGDPPAQLLRTPGTLPRAQGQRQVLSPRQERDGGDGGEPGSKARAQPDRPSPPRAAGPVAERRHLDFAEGADGAGRPEPSGRSPGQAWDWPGLLQRLDAREAAPEQAGGLLRTLQAWLKELRREPLAALPRDTETLLALQRSLTRLLCQCCELPETRSGLLLESVVSILGFFGVEDGEEECTYKGGGCLNLNQQRTVFFLKSVL
ncbi:hypothetical protein QBZ16_001261 [Prototheca wickerhamii]|uniref:Uncharacterized protein n=1 Tax=Prototheca wickerhamii TaxID=3111 RepID=A0AAD9IF37_PROWI|nr:hypothetical protein QBZ16_001261 [Prototheca wickerhamii]